MSSSSNVPPTNSKDVFDLSVQVKFDPANSQEKEQFFNILYSVTINQKLVSKFAADIEKLRYKGFDLQAALSAYQAFLFTNRNTSEACDVHIKLLIAVTLRGPKRGIKLLSESNTWANAVPFKIDDKNLWSVSSIQGMFPHHIQQLRIILSKHIRRPFDDSNISYSDLPFELRFPGAAAFNLPSAMRAKHLEWCKKFSETISKTSKVPFNQEIYDQISNLRMDLNLVDPSAIYAGSSSTSIKNRSVTVNNYY